MTSPINFSFLTHSRPMFPFYTPLKKTENQKCSKHIWYDVSLNVSNNNESNIRINTQSFLKVWPKSKYTQLNTLLKNSM